MMSRRPSPAIPPRGGHSPYHARHAPLRLTRPHDRRGRDLAMWTNYRGLDPEISYQPPNILPRQELLTMPLPRELVVRLDVRP